MFKPVKIIDFNNSSEQNMSEEFTKQDALNSVYINWEPGDWIDSYKKDGLLWIASYKYEEVGKHYSNSERKNKTLFRLKPATNYKDISDINPQFKDPIIRKNILQSLNFRGIEDKEFLKFKPYCDVLNVTYLMSKNAVQRLVVLNPDILEEINDVE